jgi:hypothetical protein
LVPSSPNKRANANLAEAAILPLSQPILTMHKSNNKKKQTTHDISQKLNSQNPTFGAVGITTNGKVFAVHLNSLTRETQHNRNRTETTHRSDQAPTSET